MADFDPPFAIDAERRLPSTTERENGFACGPADRTLFNGLFHRVESEIGEVINFAGIAPTDDRHTLLREAIENLIAAATGGGDTSQFLLTAQARVRLPIFPEIQTATGALGVTSPGVGQVRIPGGVTFLHRGIFPVTTVLADLLTDASKTYHLRWDPTDGFALKDVASPVYNPSAAAETSAVFDSTYDDMLVARVITNSSNIPTITDLVNKARVLLEVVSNGAATVSLGVNGASRTANLSWNLARTPIMGVYYSAIGIGNGASNNGFSGSASHDHDEKITRVSFTRYGTTLTLLRDYAWNLDIIAQVIA